MARKTGLSGAFEVAIKDLALNPEDAAMVELGRKYAGIIDGNEDMLNVLGRAYRETLIELGMSPKARAALMKGESDKPKQASPLDELRARRERRVKGS